MAQTGEPITFDDLKRRELSGVYEMSISPEQARRIVRATQITEANFRRISDDNRLASMANAMRRGEWIWTDADPIRLEPHAATGEIIATDGQHRLMAAAQARRVLRTIVLWGPSWRSGLHVDRNKPRNVAQYLTHEYNLKNATVFATVARMHISRILGYHRGTTSGYAAQLVRDEQIIALVVNKEEEIHWGINRYQAAASRGFNSIAYACFLYETRQVSHELSEKFHEDMKSADLDPTDPLGALRRAIAGKFTATGRRQTRGFSMDNLVKAWNLRAGSETVSNWRNASDDVYFPLGFKIPDLDTLETVESDRDKAS